MYDLVVSNAARRGSAQVLVRTCAVLVGLLCVAVLVEHRDRKREKIRGDLTRFSLAASHVIAADGNPYSKREVGRNYKYLPTNAVLLTPLTKVDTYRAQGIWFSINLGLLIWCVAIHSRMLRPLQVPRWVTIVTVLICLRLFSQNLKLGQWNTSVYSLSFIGLYYLFQHATFRGAAAIGLASVLKFTPMVFIAMLALRRNWKHFSFAVLAMVLWSVGPSLVMIGPEKTLELHHKFAKRSQNTFRNISSGPNVYSVSLRSTIYRYLFPAQMTFDDRRTYTTNIVDLGSRTAARASTAVVLLFVVATAFLTVRYGAARNLAPAGQLAVIGNWFALVLLCSPGLREAQMLAVFTPLFATISWLATNRGNRVGWLYLYAGALALVINAPTHIWDGSLYNERLQVAGILAVAQLVLWGHTAYIVWVEGRKSETAPMAPSALMS